MIGSELALGEWLSALVIIIFIDLVLAGDNAVVIAMAARSLPKRLQRRAVLFGTACAIAVRVLMTLVVFWIIGIPLLRAAGGLLLLWVAVRMMSDSKQGGDKHTAAGNLAEAIKVIVIADTVMGLDNILAIAGAAKGDVTLVVIGLLVSIPIMVWGSFVLLRLLERHPWIVFLGGAVLAYVGASMLLDDPWVGGVLEHPEGAARWGILAALTAAVTAAGWLAHRRGYSRASSSASPK